MLTGIPRSNLWLKAIDSLGICVRQLLVGTVLHHLKLQEGLRTTENVHKGTISFREFHQSFTLSLLLVKSSICFFTLTVV